MRPQHSRNSCFFLLPYANDLPKAYNFELSLDKYSVHKYDDLGQWPGQQKENRVGSSIYGSKRLNEDFLILGHYTVLKSTKCWQNINNSNRRHDLTLNNLIQRCQKSSRQRWVLYWAPTDLQNCPRHAGVVRTPLPIKLLSSTRHLD